MREALSIIGNGDVTESVELVIIWVVHFTDLSVSSVKGHTILKLNDMSTENRACHHRSTGYQEAIIVDRADESISSGHQPFHTYQLPVL